MSRDGAHAIENRVVDIKQVEIQGRCLPPRTHSLYCSRLNRPVAHITLLHDVGKV